MFTDYSSLLANRALYLPAISDTYAMFAHSGRFKRITAFTAQDLNFLDPSNRLFFYPWALVSAGQAAKSKSGASRSTMVSERDRNRTTVVGDSGGFQILTDKIAFEGAATTRRMMRWLEANTDYSMVLDFPTGGIASGVMAKHATRLEAEGHDLAAMCRANGQSRGFNACLRQTLINNDQFVAERSPGATKFLNVLQGRNDAESRVWFDAVKHYPFEGWAFAGAHCRNLSLMLRRLIDMRNEGLLQRCSWLHVLGLSTLEFACLFTTLQQAIRDHVNPTFQISYDSASPFKSAAYFNAYQGCTLSKNGWGVPTINIGGEENIGSEVTLFDFLAEKFIAERWKKQGPGDEQRIGTAISRHLRMGDICVETDNNAAWADESAHLVMNHNVQALIEAIRAAHVCYFEQDQNKVPVRLRAIQKMIQLVFKNPNPDQLIEEYRPWLDNYEQAVVVGPGYETFADRAV